MLLVVLRRAVCGLIVACAVACQTGHGTRAPSPTSTAAPAPAPANSSRNAVEPAAAPRSEPPRGHLRVGTSFDYAPFSTRDSAGKVAGFDAEIAQLLAHDLALELEWVGFRWPTLQAQIERGEFDVAMAGVTWQPARAVVGYMTRAV